MSTYKSHFALRFFFGLPGEARGKPRGHRGATERLAATARRSTRSWSRGSSTTGVGQGNTDLPRILDKDFITSLAVHSKFICSIRSPWTRRASTWPAAPMDERVIIHNLFNKKTYSTLKLDKPVYAVAISPNFAATQSYVTGDDRLILVEPGFIKKQHRVLAEARPNCGAIRCIVWANSLVVWGTEEGVRAYCLVERRSLTSLPRPATETDRTAAFIQV
uniref:CNH domain-containing protein n=1 Tax=Macrostomum lignano TaxID=282301 RepID=A0A1I8FT14_9PLAT